MEDTGGNYAGFNGKYVGGFKPHLRNFYSPKIMGPAYGNMNDRRHSTIIPNNDKMRRTDSHGNFFKN